MANKVSILATALRRTKTLKAVFLAITLCCVTLAGEHSNDKKSNEVLEPKLLTIGSLAPALDIESWISKGDDFDEVTEMQEGQVYVIEFWATWCGPCLECIPHLAKLQQRYRNHKVQIVSISSEDIDTVKEFLKQDYVETDESLSDASGNDFNRKPPSTYADLTRWYCVAVDPDRRVHSDYVDAAKQFNIPVAFLVGKSGRIEWIGHPMKIDEPLQQVLASKWDRDAFANKYNHQHQLDIQLAKVIELAKNSDFSSAYDLISKIEADAEDALAIQMVAYRTSVELWHMQSLADDGMTQEAIAMADTAIRNSTGPTQMQWRSQKFHMLLSARRDDDAAELLTSLTEECDASSLARMAGAVHGVAGLSPKLIAATITAAETATKLKPDYIETFAILARLVHTNGELDRAIELQSHVVENAKKNRLAHIEFLKRLEVERKEGNIKGNRRSAK